MTDSRRLFKFLLCIVISAIMTVTSVINCFAIISNVSAEDVSHNIAIVFDNSGSMYAGKDYWYKAKYAMDVFATMVFTNKGSNDKISIYPMHSINWSGNVDDEATDKPLEIRSEDDIDKIKNIYTPLPGKTPFDPVESAANKLMSDPSNSEKWLIILCDGQFDSMDGESAPKDEFIPSERVQNKLESYASRGIKVQYLCFFKNSGVVSNKNNTLFVTEPSTDEFNSAMINACNLIFNRSELIPISVGSYEYEFDLSMKHLIVFVQGDKTEIKSLVNKKDNDVNRNFIERIIEGSKLQLSCGKYWDTPELNPRIEKELKGRVVTFSDIEKGSYKLDIEGAAGSDIQVFYEPDVNIEITLSDSDGNTYTEKEISDGSVVLKPGEYSVNYDLIDGRTGDPVKSKLLTDINLSADVTVDGKELKKGAASGEKITIEGGENLSIIVHGDYKAGNKKYRISSDNSGGFGNLQLIKGDIDNSRLKAVINIEQENNWYNLHYTDSWKPIKVSFEFDGQQIKTDINPVINIEGLMYSTKFNPDDATYYITLGEDTEGNFIKPEGGKYKITAQAQYLDEYNNELQNSAAETFDIEPYSIIWRWLSWVVGVGGFLILLGLFLNHKTMPKSIFVQFPKVTHAAKISGKRVAISTNFYPNELSCEVKPVTSFMRRKNKNAKVKVMKVRPLGSIIWFEIDGERFTKTTGSKFVDSEGNVFEKHDGAVFLTDGTSIRWRTNQHTASGTVMMNHRN